MRKLTRTLAQTFGLRQYNNLFELDNRSHSLSLTLTPPTLSSEDTVRIKSGASLLLSVTETAKKYSKGRASEYYPLRNNQLLQLASCDLTHSRLEFVSSSKAVMVWSGEAETVSILVFDRQQPDEALKKKEFYTSANNFRQLQALLRSGLEHYTHLRLAHLHHFSSTAPE